MSAITHAITLRLKSALKRSGKSSSDLAKELGISRQAAWALLHKNAAPNYTIETLERIAPLVGLRMVVEFQAVEVGATEIEK